MLTTGEPLRQPGFTSSHFVSVMQLWLVCSTYFYWFLSRCIAMLAVSISNVATYVKSDNHSMFGQEPRTAGSLFWASYFPTAPRRYEPAARPCAESHTPTPKKVAQRTIRPTATADTHFAFRSLLFSPTILATLCIVNSVCAQ